MSIPDNFDVNKYVARTEFATLVEEGRKFCWSTTQTTHFPDAELILVFEDHESYFTLDFGAMPLVIAEEIAKDRNKALGLSMEEVNRIIVTSMVKARQSGRMRK